MKKISWLLIPALLWLSSETYAMWLRDVLKQVGAGPFLATGVGGFIVIIGALLSYVAISYGIYLLSKKYEPSLHPAWSWIPVANVYPVVKISQQPLWWIAVILLVGFIPAIWGLATFLSIIFIYHKISERCGRGPGTTALLVFFSVITFPWLGLSVNKKDTSIAWILGVAALIVSMTGSVVVGAGALSGVLKVSQNPNFIREIKSELRQQLKNNPAMQEKIKDMQNQLGESTTTPTSTPTAGKSTAE